MNAFPDAQRSVSISAGATPARPVDDQSATCGIAGRIGVQGRAPRQPGGNVVRRGAL